MLNYVAGSNKGGIVGTGDDPTQFNGVFRMGEMSEDRQRYTSDRVVEKFEYADMDSTKKIATVAWTPMISASKVLKRSTATGDWSELATTAYTVDATAGTVTLTDPLQEGMAIKVAYIYNNVNIPQNDLPILNAKLDRIPLIAKARRIAIYYSQIANFQAKTDYGFDLGDGLAEQAKAELMYEIDSETVQLLDDAAEKKDKLVWSRTLPVGVSKLEHYAGFAELIERAKVYVYKKTQKFQPNWMLVAADCLPVISFIPGWKADNNAHIAGPYKAGTLNGLAVYVSPMMETGEYVLGVNGGDLQTGAAVYAPLENYAKCA